MGLLPLVYTYNTQALSTLAGGEFQSYSVPGRVVASVTAWKLDGDTDI